MNSLKISTKKRTGKAVKTTENATADRSTNVGLHWTDLKSLEQINKKTERFRIDYDCSVFCLEKDNIKDK